MPITVFAESPPHGYQLIIQLLHSMNLDNSLTVVKIPKRQQDNNRSTIRYFGRRCSVWFIIIETKYTRTILLKSKDTLIKKLIL